MQKSGAVARFTKILDRGDNFTPSPNKRTYIEKPIHNRVNIEDRFILHKTLDGQLLI